ncbi:MAG TPA: translation initiation factor IF-2, partial [Ilumatobacteraceae bacterium]|nr:translation initiation factor IF-2 [Ilumatobacteraceae bacterium]
MTNQEMMTLTDVMGVGVKSHSSTLIEAQADRLRRRAERDGLTRPEQPEEVKPAKKTKKAAAAAAVDAAATTDGAPAAAPVKKAAAKKVAEPKTAPAKDAPVADTPATVAAAPVEEAKKAPAVDEAPAPSLAEPPSAPSAAAPPAPTPSAPAEPAVAATPPVVAPAPTAPVEKAPDVSAAPAPSIAESPAASSDSPAASSDSPARITSSRPTGEPPRPAARPDVTSAPAASSAPAPSVPRPAAASGRPAGPPPGRPPGPPPARPTSTSGKPIPPPPGGGRPMSSSGKPIPPPPGGLRAGGPAARPGAPGAPRTGAYSARPGAPGARPGAPGARPGFAPRPGGPGGPRPGGGFAPRPGGGPGGGPGGAGGPGARPGGGGGPRPNGQRRAPRKKSRARRRRDFDEMQPNYNSSYTATNAPVPEGTIIVERGVSAQEFAPKLNRTAADVIRFLLQNGEMVTATMTLTDEQMELFALEVNADLLLVEPGQQEELELQALFDDSDDDDETLQVPRAPVITVMGHVDHGKTTLLDKIRKANVVAGEAGGITQHIGAYKVDVDGREITFLDTPGHAAFTKMRARGAQVTDIVVLMVAADDGVMPQTIEAINHARAAEVPIVVALNKIDKENADVQRVLSELSEHGLIAESWGGDTIVVEMSAQQNLGIDDLLEQLAAVAEVEELTANPTGRAKGVVLEAKLDVGRGPVATILVDKGELKVGDPIVAGGAWGRVRAMINDKGEQVKTAGPSTPVQVLGLQSVPHACFEFRSALTEKTARTVGEAREQRYRLKAQRGDARLSTGVKLEDIFNSIQAGEVATLNIVLKADVQGSLEA